MRGEERQQRSMLMVMNVEERVPRDHPLRRVKQLAETVLSELFGTFDRIYSATGRLSIPPQRLLKALGGDKGYDTASSLRTVARCESLRTWHRMTGAGAAPPLMRVPRAIPAMP